jgi:type II secretory pathway pseudopilin PulG
MERVRRASTSESGDTLIEVLLAIAVVAITGAALIGAVLTSVTASSEHRSLALNDASLKTYADSAFQQIQRQASPLWQPCASSYAVTRPAEIPSTYSIGISGIQYWDSSAGAWSGSCPSSTAPQLITVVVTSPTQLKSSLSFAVRSPS